MKLAVYGPGELLNELMQANAGIEWLAAGSPEALFNEEDAAAYFLLDESAENIPAVAKPVFINAITKTLHEINAGQQSIRINGWNGFLQKQKWEVAGNISDEAKEVLNALNKEIIPCTDEPGFISPRVIALIINEAYYALQEGVSTKKEIDTAMKLGTNYPFGPFEWSEIIGLRNIYALLEKLSQTDKRYLPASLLQKEAIA
ncbi:MAG: 3-hydroxyacyl-CoA dehydrogenase family protein [Ferruginibacter sp.]